MEVPEVAVHVERLHPARGQGAAGEDAMSESQGSEGTTQSTAGHREGRPDPTLSTSRRRRPPTTPAPGRRQGAWRAALLVGAPRPGRDHGTCCSCSWRASSCTTSPPCAPAGRPCAGAANWPDQLAERPLDDIWVLVGAGVAAALGLWLLLLALTPGLRSVLPMRRTHPDVRAGLAPGRWPPWSCATGPWRSPACSRHGYGCAGRKADVRAVSHFRELDDVRADLDAVARRRDQGPGAGPPALVVGACAAAGAEGVRAVLRTVNRVLVGLVGLVLLVIGGSVLAVGLGLDPPSWWIHDGRHDVLLSDAERTRWRDDGWWWPTVIAVLAVVVLLALWWLTSVLRRRRLTEVLVDTGDGEGALLRGRALEGVLAGEAAGQDGVQRARVHLTGRRSTPRGPRTPPAGTACGPRDGPERPHRPGPGPRPRFGGPGGIAGGGPLAGRQAPAER